jgi:hypothetical protein
MLEDSNGEQDTVFKYTKLFNPLMCVIPVMRINYLKESNSQNTTCLEIDGIFYN